MKEIQGIRKRYDREFRQREDQKLEEARAKFCTNTAAATNEAEICESGGNKDAKEIRMYQEYIAMDMERRLMVREVSKRERN